MVSFIRHVLHIMAHNVHLAAILVTLPKRQRSLVVQLGFGNQLTFRAQVNVQYTIIQRSHARN